MSAIYIGDAVVTKTGPANQPTMTVYDLTDRFTVAHCNWLDGHTMHKRIIPVAHLRTVQRKRTKA